MKYILLDTETTGTGEQDRVIQLGYMVIDQRTKQVEVFDEYCSTSQPITFEAMEVHNITPDMIENRPLCNESEAYQNLTELNNDANIMIIHNASFDLGMLKKEGFDLRMRLIDSLRCARHLYPELDAHRLQYMRYKCEFYRDEKEEAESLGLVIKAHDAIGDVLVMKLLLRDMVKRVQKNYAGVNPIDKLVELTKTPVEIKKFKFGKYKGRTVESVAQEDSDYLRWMKKKMDLDEDMLFTINKYV
jgi:DNA polymerase-3 subunit epsilon/exodeoxyribonuclease X